VAAHRFRNKSGVKETPIFGITVSITTAVMTSKSPHNSSKNGTEDVRRRFACDRCHTQKTRCPRKPGQAVCDRCVKAKSECLFSPFRQKKVSEQDGNIDQEDFKNAGIDVSAKTTEANNVTSRKRARLSPDVDMDLG
jgi:hypothetical protein